MRTTLLVLVAVSLVACKKERAAESSSSSMADEWEQRSADGTVELSQRREDSRNANECRVQAVSKTDKRTLWTSKTCLPTPSCLVFIGKGGEKLLVFDLFPGGAAAQSPDWRQVSLVQLWDKGVVVRQYKGAEILATDRAVDMRRSLSWLRGATYEEVRDAARAVAGESQVSADLVDGRTITFGFDRAPLPTPPAVSAPPPTEEAPAPEPAQAAEPERPASTLAAGAAEPGGLIDGEMYTWVDERGVPNFGYGMQVPPKFRKAARPVQGNVGVVPTEARSVNQAQPAAPQPGQVVVLQPGQPVPPTGQPTPQPAGPQPR